LGKIDFTFPTVVKNSNFKTLQKQSKHLNSFQKSGKKTTKKVRIIKVEFK
jgi:hydroxymethylglutaryl-CoA reductase